MIYYRRRQISLDKLGIIIDTIILIYDNHRELGKLYLSNVEIYFFFLSAYLGVILYKAKNEILLICLNLT